MSALLTRLSQFATVRTCREVFRTMFSRKYLLYTNTAISVVMSCTGDGLQQNYQLVKKQMIGWDFRRSRDVAITGLLIGPFCHYWYIFLDWWLPGRTGRILVKKVIVDQFVCSPIVIGSFLVITSWLEGKKGREFKNEVIGKGKLLYIAEWIVWPPLSAFNFWIVPLRFRVLFDTMVSFGFDWYFSYVKYGKRTFESEEYSYIDSAELNEFISSVQFCGTGAHVPFIHVQAAELVQIGLERKRRHQQHSRIDADDNMSRERTDDEVQNDGHHMLDGKHLVKRILHGQNSASCEISGERTHWKESSNSIAGERTHETDASCDSVIRVQTNETVCCDISGEITHDTDTCDPVTRVQTNETVCCDISGERINQNVQDSGLVGKTLCDQWSVLTGS